MARHLIDTDIDYDDEDEDDDDVVFDCDYYCCYLINIDVGHLSLELFVVNFIENKIGLKLKLINSNRFLSHFFENKIWGVDEKIKSPESICNKI